MKLHSCPLLPLIYFTFNSSVSGIDFFVKWNLLDLGFLFFLLRNHQILQRSRKNNTVKKRSESSQGGFCGIFPGYWKLMGKALYFLCGKV